MTTNTGSAEAYIVDRYEQLWHRWQPNFDYKYTKGRRIAQIIATTGGPVPIAMELGVGPGGVAAAVSRHGIKVVGIDLSSEALIRAREHCRSENVTLMRGSGFSLPVRDAGLPLVYASQVLHLFDAAGRLAIMREVHRALKPGGRFVFDMKNASSHVLRVLRYSAERRHKNFPRQGEIVDLLRQAGFVTIRKRAGVLPLLGAAPVPNFGIVRRLAHTTFFVATKP
jgi:SAM-dependent methyltransferase